MELAERLRTIRRNKDLSLYRLSKLSGISYSFLHALERGDRVPTVTTLDRICTSLQISLAEFFAFPESAPKVSAPAAPYPSLHLEPWQVRRLQDFVASLQSPPMLGPESLAGPAPVDRGSLVETLLLHLVQAVQHQARPLARPGDELTARAGLKAAADIDEAYKRAWKLQRALQPAEYAHLVVDLSQRLGGTWEIERDNQDAVSFRVIAWPFGGSAWRVPGVRSLMQALIGGIAVHNFGYAKVSSSSGNGSYGEHFTVYLRHTPESAAAEGWVYPSRPSR